MPVMRGLEGGTMLFGEGTMIAKHILTVIRSMRLMAVISIIWTANVNGQSINPPIGTPLPDPPQIVTSFELHAINDPARDDGAFVFEGREVPPVIRAVPGGAIHFDYVNQMSKKSSEVCVNGPCMNMTNIHFHGFHVSPDALGDDVLTMIAMPGESLHYTADIPADQPPGLYWYHTHPHGESYQQDLDGMSGIVIDGRDRYFPEIKNMKENFLTLRDAELEKGDPSSLLLKSAVQLAPYRCGAATGEATRVFSVNGAVRPKIAIASGEK
jgi:FtsP/CotA-like multicopper oxidase with cupredoxin domain